MILTINLRGPTAWPTHVRIPRFLMFHIKNTKKVFGQILTSGILYNFSQPTSRPEPNYLTRFG